MNTFFGTLWHRIAVSNKEQLVWFGAVVIIMIVLAVLHHKWKGDKKKIRLWRGRSSCTYLSERIPVVYYRVLPALCSRTFRAPANTFRKAQDRI